MSTEISVEYWLARPGKAPARRDVRLTIDNHGILARSVAGAGLGRMALPAPVNAHDHGYGVRTLDFGCMDDALEPWIAGLRVRPAADPYLEALVAFGRIARSGCAATMHCHNSLNVDRLVEEAGDVARAARTCGIKLALSCPMLDASPFVYGGSDQFRKFLPEADWRQIEPLVPRYAPVADQVAAVEEIALRHAGEGVDVQFGPIGPQWASDELLEAIADASHRTGLRVHMHLLESSRQRVWLDSRFEQGVVQHLDRIGFLSPRLAVAHGVQLRPDECDLLAERGVIVVSNPSANLRLRSGVAPIADFHSSNLEFAIGLDGSGFDDDQDFWREIRLFWFLHSGRGIEPSLTPAAIFRAVTDVGAKVVNLSVVNDVAFIDYGALSEDAIFDDLDEAEVILNRMSARYVTDLVVSGKRVVKDGRLITFDFEEARAELRAQARAAMPRLEAERKTARMLSAAIRRHYKALYP
jgi:5-methylthioadenosine/S-adenosylhomocysteine deaminase